MHLIDNFLLDRVYQPVCDALYEQVGDCILLARGCLNASMIACVMLVVWLLSYKPIPWLDVASEFLMAGNAVYLKWRLQSMIGFRGPNPTRIALFYIRIFFIIWLVPGWFTLIPTFKTDPVLVILCITRDFALINAVFFASCNNRPPMKRYARMMHAPA